jgi:hypothetical protein
MNNVAQNMNERPSAQKRGPQLHLIRTTTKALGPRGARGRPSRKTGGDPTFALRNSIDALFDSLIEICVAAGLSDKNVHYKRGLAAFISASIAVDELALLLETRSMIATALARSVFAADDSIPTDSEV